MVNTISPYTRLKYDKMDYYINIDGARKKRRFTINDCLEITSILCIRYLKERRTVICGFI